MHSIVIKLGDNDFYYTFVNLLDTIYRAIDESSLEEPFTQEQIIDLIKRGTFFHYVAFQNRYRYQASKEEFDHIEQYLSKVTVLFDDEADAYYQAGDQNSEAWHLHIPSGQINSF